MIFNGQNKLILTAESLREMLGQSLNGHQEPHMPTIRVLSVSRSGYGSDLEFVITTDPETLTIESKE